MVLLRPTFTRLATPAHGLSGGLVRSTQPSGRGAQRANLSRKMGLRKVVRNHSGSRMGAPNSSRNSRLDSCSMLMCFEERIETIDVFIEMKHRLAGDDAEDIVKHVEQEWIQDCGGGCQSHRGQSGNGQVHVRRTFRCGSEQRGLCDCSEKEQSNLAKKIKAGLRSCG